MSSIINKTYSINVPANGSLLLPSGGTYVYCTDANLTSFRIAIDDVAEGKCGPGLGYERGSEEEPFSAVRIVNDNGAALTGTIVIGTGRILDNRLTLTGAVNVSVASTLDSLADVACADAATTSVLAANSARREAVIHNKSATATVKWCDAGGAAANGIPLAPGQTAFLNVTDQVYIRNDSGGSVDVAVAELT